MKPRIRPNPSDSEIVFCATPSAMVNRLIPIITTDRTIADYVNRHFGTKITAARVGELRKNKPLTEMTDHGEPIATTEQREFEKAAKKSNAKFLNALKAVAS